MIRRARPARGLLAAAALGLAPAAALAQVGHPPEGSPYRDIVNHQAVTAFVGHFAGTPGPAGVGAQSATAFGLRLTVRLSNPIDLWATFGEARSSRLVIDASGDTAKSLGDRPLNFLLADLGLALNLTGDKSWHRLAPYLGAGVGVTAPSRSTVDPGGFQLGTSFALMPTIGTRWFIAPSLALHFEARDYMYRVQYPLRYFLSYWITDSAARPILPGDAADRQWTHNFVLWIGASYTFTF